MKLPIMKPRISVARFSFFLASRRFSRSGSRGFTVLVSPLTSSFECRDASPCSLFSLPTCFRPKIGWHSLSFNGFTTAHRDTTPLSDDDGSNSDTMSTSMPTLGARHRGGTLADWPSPFTDSVAFRLLFCVGSGTLTCRQNSPARNFSHARILTPAFLDAFLFSRFVFSFFFLFFFRAIMRDEPTEKLARPRRESLAAICIIVDQVP